MFGELGTEGPAVPPARGTGAGNWKSGRARIPAARTRVADFPDHKLTFWREGNNIGVCVTYLPAEHDESSIQSFVECLCDVIDAATGTSVGETERCQRRQ